MARDTADEQTNDSGGKRRLGRGLAALIGEMDPPVASGPAPDTEASAARSQTTVSADGTVPIESVQRNPNNPRRDFAEDDLSDLAASIAEHGVVQPLLVRPIGPDSYEIVAGERRWRAAQRAGLHQVPIVIREVDDREALELAIIENVQRADLNPVEEARGYQQLIDEHGYRQAELGKVIGKSRSHVANTLRLLNLPDSVIVLVGAGALSAGHARALIPMDRPEKLARRIVDEGLSVREAEKLASFRDDTSKNSKKANKKPKDADTRALEKQLSDAIGMNVTINAGSGEQGILQIKYRSLEQLEMVMERLTG